MAYRYDLKTGFEEIAEPIEWPENTVIDSTAYMREHWGYDINLSSADSVFNVTVFHNRPENAWCVSFWDQVGGFGDVYCYGLPSYFEFLRLYALPFLQVSHYANFEPVLEQIETVVFDPELGIGPARRVGMRERRWARERAAAQRAREARAKAAPAAVPGSDGSSS